MTITLTNDPNFKQKFVYLFQVKNIDNLVESIFGFQVNYYPNKVWVFLNLGLLKNLEHMKLKHLFGIL